MAAWQDAGQDAGVSDATASGRISDVASRLRSLADDLERYDVVADDEDRHSWHHAVYMELIVEIAALHAVVRPVPIVRRRWWRRESCAACVRLEQHIHELEAERDLLRDRLAQRIDAAERRVDDLELGVPRSQLQVVRVEDVVDPEDLR